jgi:hypothetical protein
VRATHRDGGPNADKCARRDLNNHENITNETQASPWHEDNKDVKKHTHTSRKERKKAPSQTQKKKKRKKKKEKCFAVMTQMDSGKEATTSRPGGVK